MTTHLLRNSLLCGVIRNNSSWQLFSHSSMTVRKRKIMEHIRFSGSGINPQVIRNHSNIGQAIAKRHTKVPRGNFKHCVNCGLLLYLTFPHPQSNYYDDYEHQNNAHFQEIFLFLIFLLFESLLLKLAYPTEVARKNKLKYSCCCESQSCLSPEFSGFCNRAFLLTRG